MAARRFLYVIATLILLVLAFGVAWSLFQDRLLRAAFVPTVKFQPMAEAGAPDYRSAAGWLSRPGLANDPSLWLPAGYPAGRTADVAVFFVPPTTYLGRDQWNAPLDDAAANGRLRLFASSQASAFSGVGRIWAPRYRQATMGAFLTRSRDADAALDFAYRDVERAFDAFLAAVPADRPILLAGHSQGSLHLTTLLARRIAGTPVARRIVAAYLVGWPISKTADLPALGLPACAGAAQTNCIVSWQSFAEPAEPRQLRALYDASTGLTGRPRAGSDMVCTNPLTGVADGAAPASANLGALVPKNGLTDADLTPGLVPAHCAAPGLLLIGAPPEGFGAAVLPGGNFHVFDYALFWANVRADAARRAAAFAGQAGRPR
ncbi:MAG: hypothetical protein JWL91_1898 [Sphingomonas bacterium]|nr:DUF3089 domain-containing protein [Sphingomonas bacterium]MDB5690022.1 hypothetical protein [Sphingomonas bacterium]